MPIQSKQVVRNLATTTILAVLLVGCATSRERKGGANPGAGADASTLQMGEQTATCSELLSSIEPGQACTGTWHCYQEIEGSTGTHRYDYRCVDGVIEYEQRLAAHEDPLPAVPSDAGVGTNTTADGQVDPATNTGPICAALCESGCPTSWGGEDGRTCATDCDRAITDCSASELTALEGCIGLCDRLEPCIRDVACSSDSPASVSIACGAYTCHQGEICVGCVGQDVSHAYCAPSDGRPLLERAGAELANGCEVTSVFMECDSADDCGPGEICRHMHGEWAVAECVEDSRGSEGASCGRDTDCQVGVTSCEIYDPFGYYAQFGDAIFMRQYACLPQ